MGATARESEWMLRTDSVPVEVTTRPGELD